jgi:hypothetical protein
MIYFITNGSDVKIGHTDGCPMKRMKQLQTGSPLSLCVMGTIPGNREDEAKLHDLFSPFRLEGEWFRYSLTSFELMENLVDDFGERWGPGGPLGRMSKPCLYPTDKGYKEAIRPVERHVSALVGFTIDLEWGAEPRHSGATGRDYSFRAVPYLGPASEDKRSMACEFMRWHRATNRQWFTSYHRAARGFVREWQRWRGVKEPVFAETIA